MADGDRFRPANGTEGLDFTCAWCARCACEPDTDPNGDPSDDGCPILGESYALKVEDEEYPPELVYRGGVGICTAFIQRVGNELLDPRAVAKKRTAYDALPRDPTTGRPTT